MSLTPEQYENKIKELEKEIVELKKRQTVQMKRQQYGLTWIDVPEAFDKESENKIPVLEEVKDKAISNDDGKPTHILIEGDNYHALQCLNYTHKGKVDVIYIDPPYNTGNTKDGKFIYKDKRIIENYPDGMVVEKDNPLRHSYWLSFMKRRLILAKTLMSEIGVIFISIDDNEQANLKLLCDKIFGEKNFISNIFILDNLKGKTNDTLITSVGSRLYVYAKNIEKIIELGFNEVENIFGEKIENKFKKEDEYGPYNPITFKKTGQSKLREDRPNMFYPILQKNGRLYSITQKEFESIFDKNTKIFNDEYLSRLKNKYSDYEFILPKDSDGKYLRWTSGFVTFCKKMNDEIFYDNDVKQKNRPEPNEMLQIYASGTPKSLMYKPSYSMGTDDYKNVMGIIPFDFPKPLQLIYDINLLYPKKSYTILDFFAGSGTTLHATMKLNAEDGGNRQCILVQAPENNICEEVTYERNKRVIQGYTNSKGEQIPGLGNSLKYYKTAFVGNHDAVNATDDDCVTLAKKAGCLLSIGENTLDEIQSTDFFQIYEDKNSKLSTAIYFTEELSHFDDFVENVKKVASNHKTVIVYTFSWSSCEDFIYEFEGIPNVEIKAIPQPILEIYKSIYQK